MGMAEQAVEVDWEDSSHSVAVALVVVVVQLGCRAVAVVALPERKLH